MEKGDTIKKARGVRLFVRTVALADFRRTTASAHVITLRLVPLQSVL